MKTYSIFGLGSSLLDIEVIVQDERLSEIGLQKGSMKLVDRSKQQEILSYLGESGRVKDKKSGGSVCNSLIASACLGTKVFFNGVVGDDDDGAIFLKDLNECGVYSNSLIKKQSWTGQCLVMVTPDAERTMCTSLGVNADLSKHDIDIESLIKSDWLFIEGYLITNDSHVEAIETAVRVARENSVSIAISLSDSNLVKVFHNALLSIIGEGVDFIFCNKAEAFSFSKKGSIQASANVIRNHSRRFAITDGANGVFVFDGENLSKVDGIPSDAIDTNGAGDMFAGVLLHGLSRGEKLREAAAFANYCASRVVAKFGPRLTKSDFVNIKEIYSLY